MMSLSKLFSRASVLDLNGFTDWHCHLLPGVDDGVRTMDESLAILQDYETLGISEVWLTPHIMEDIPNTVESLRTRFDELRDAYQGNVRLHLASENMLDNLFMDRLESNDLLPIGEDRNTLLVETSYFNAPYRLGEMFEAIKSKGYTPLLAHPERYNYITSMSEYRKLRDMGVIMQVNLMSLCGHYGEGPRTKAYELLAEGLVDRLGSDLHRRGHLEVIRNIKVSKKRIESLKPLLKGEK